MKLFFLLFEAKMRLSNWLEMHLSLLSFHRSLCAFVARALPLKRKKIYWLFVVLSSRTCWEVFEFWKGTVWSTLLWLVLGSPTQGNWSWNSDRRCRSKRIKVSLSMKICRCQHEMKVHRHLNSFWRRFRMFYYANEAINAAHQSELIETRSFSSFCVVLTAKITISLRILSVKCWETRLGQLAVRQLFKEVSLLLWAELSIPITLNNSIS